MTTLREAAQQALEALDAYSWEQVDAARTALKTALAEPVAWMVYTLDGKSVCVTDNPADFTDQHRVLPLYTSPPQRTPLTREEVDQIWESEKAFSDIYAITRAVEAAHGIKEGT